MAHFEIVGDEVELYFDSKPSNDIRAEMKAIRIWWNPAKKCWHGKNSPQVLALAKRLCGDGAAAAPAPASTLPMDTARCCYHSSVEAFIGMDKQVWIEAMKSAFLASYAMPLEEAQVRAWKDCFNVLQAELPVIEAQYPGLQIIFEYALPYESGRRPDVILLSKEHVIVLEFKQFGTVEPAHVDQVKAYARDLREYHFESRNRQVTPVLLLTGIDTQKPELRDGIILCSKGWLGTLVEEIVGDGITPCDAETWMNSKYEPLPTIVEAARTFMNHEELPNIRRVNSTVIPQAIARLTELAQDAKANRRHVLALVTGVPGAGKTYLGLQYVYDICESNEHVNSVYLSGNGPLVKVLQDALQSKVFVRDVHTVVNEFTRKRMGSFEKNIIVFDEGQRAWDIGQMEKKRHVSQSEPDVMVELCDTKLDWCVLLILVGEGQEIYNGENSGLAQWNTAVKAAKKEWSIVCPDKLKDVFEAPAILEPALDLNQSLRTHTAGEVSNCVNDLIRGDLAAAAAKSAGILKDGFTMYYTRDLERAKQYCRDRYPASDQKRFGLISSSKSKNLYPYHMKPTYQADVAAWFNRPPSHPASSCALNVTISEFDCQGLEVDMPIIGWGDDMRWNGSSWVPSGATQDDRDYRINSYRVLLTRGRDGFIVFIPPTPDMAPIEEVFQKVGVRKLENS